MDTTAASFIENASTEIGRLKTEAKAENVLYYYIIF